MEESILISSENESINALIDHADNPTSILIIAHGAGASMHHSFMKKLACSFQENGITTVRFNFPYMEQGKKFPGNPKINITAWLRVVNWSSKQLGLPIFISGKSYGGRMASHLIAENKELNIKGLIYFGFPLHAPGKPSTDRSKHLSSIPYPQLFLQGTNDALAKIDLIRTVIADLSHAQLIEFNGADHSFKIKATKLEVTLRDISSATITWINSPV
jgi:predicted alpha/beta-hydrolase family hydrolase